MMSQRHAALQRLSMSTYDKLYRDAQVHEDRLQTKKQQLGCSSDPGVAYHRSAINSSNGKLRPMLCSSMSLDAEQPRMAAGDRLYTYHLKKQVCTHVQGITQASLYPVAPVMIPVLIMKRCLPSETGAVAGQA